MVLQMLSCRRDGQGQLSCVAEWSAINGWKVADKYAEWKAGMTETVGNRVDRAMQSWIASSDSLACAGKRKNSRPHDLGKMLACLSFDLAGKGDFGI